MERRVKPRRADDATRVILVGLSRVLEWRQLLTVVKPETLIHWHRKGFRLFWRWKSRAPGRPPIPVDLRQLIVTMAAANRTWGEERIADELLVKLGIRVSPRTVRRYMRARPPGGKRGTQAWSTFVRNHARSVLASDFFVVVTATFRVIYVFVVLEVGTRRILHWNMTAHPTADWTAQQFRMIVSGDQGHRFVIHDRDAIYAEGVDRTLEAMGLEVLKTPGRCSTSKRVLRTPDRHNTARVPGLRDSGERASSARDAPRVDPALQSRPASLEFGARHSRRLCVRGSRPRVRASSASGTLSCRCDSDPRWVASRISP